MRNKKGQFIKGHIFNHSEETKRKIGLSHRGKKRPLFSEEWKRKLGDAHKGRKYNYTEQSRKNISEAKKGEKNPMFGKSYTETHRGKRSNFWKGGITPIMAAIRGCYKYRQWRSDIFTRDDFTCVLCGIRGGYLIADHHPKLFSEIFHENKITSLEQAENCEEFWNINNGRTLCKECDKIYGHHRGKN